MVLGSKFTVDISGKSLIGTTPRLSTYKVRQDTIGLSLKPVLNTAKKAFCTDRKTGELFLMANSCSF